VQQAISDNKEVLHATFGELRDSFAKESRVATHEAAVDERLKQLGHELFETNNIVDMLKTQMRKDQLFAEQTYLPRVEHKASCDDMISAWEGADEELHASLKRLEAKSAVQSVVEADKQITDKALAGLREDVDRIEVSSKQCVDRVHAMQDAQGSWATREYAYEVAVAKAKQAAIDADEKAMIEELRREFEEEREFGRQMVRQQQGLRTEFTEAQEVLHGVKAQAAESARQCAELTSGLQAAVGREGEQRQAQLEDSAKLRGQIADLKASCEGVRHSFAAHADAHKAEVAKLWQHSTQRYLEQLDEALALHSSVDRLESSTNEIKTAIKLPKVG